MNLRTLWNERFGMVTASGSPGSALTYALGKTSASAFLVRRSEATNLKGRLPTDAHSEAGYVGRLLGWLRRTFERVEAWSHAQQMREVEAYLAQAQNTADLEERIRRLHSDLLSRASTWR